MKIDYCIGIYEDGKILQSDTDVEQWRLEMERVLPQLRITIKKIRLLKSVCILDQFRIILP